MKTGLEKILILLFLIAFYIPLSGQVPDEKSAIKAIKTGDIETLKSFIEKHPDCNCVFSNGKTGLYYTLINDQERVCEFLLKNGADPNYVVDDFSTLVWAIKYGQARIVRYLIEYGADLNVMDKKLRTPLMHAANLNNLEICKILIDRGANPGFANRKGKRAIDYAPYADESPLNRYLSTMGKLYKAQDTVPSMHDGPYIYYEGDDRLVLNYFTHDLGRKETRIIEKTIDTNDPDTLVNGFLWDKSSYPVKHQFTPNSYNVTTEGNIFAIGDVHGRYIALVSLLENNKIIDKDLHWIFGKGQLVLLGDVFDRGAMVTETLWLLYNLQQEAQQVGGNVHVLLGNHEVMALTGAHRYLNDKYTFFTIYFQEYYYQLFEKNTVLGRWLRSQNVIVRINDNLFLHAGISPQFAIFDYPYEDINSRVRAYLNTDYALKQGTPEDVILGSYGPQWYRGYKVPNDNFPEMSQQFVDNYMASKGLKRMVLGHNEQAAINSSYNGKVISCDVEINESGKSAQGLLISGDKLYRCHYDGSREQIK